MDPMPSSTCTAFFEYRCLASGSLSQVALKVREVVDASTLAQIFIFDDATGRQIDVDLRASSTEALQQLEPAAPPQVSVLRRPGRPKLGVVAREVTLLPRHWEWLSAQPGGASVALRKLVEEAKRTHADRDHCRQAQEASYRFMSVMAGNQPDFEEAIRALFAGDRARLERYTESWPTDIRDYALRLASPAVTVPNN